MNHVHKGEGVYDVPGCLCSGRVIAGGSLSKEWNQRVIASEYNETTLDYTITHNIGHTNYDVTFTPQKVAGSSTPIGYMLIGDVGATSFKVQFFNTTNGSIVKCNFSFFCFGNNQ